VPRTHDGNAVGPGAEVAVPSARPGCPFSAAQLEVSTSAASGVPFGSNSAPKIEVRVKNGAFLNLNDPGDFIVLDNSTDPSAKGRAFARAYSPMSILAKPIITFPTIKFDFVNVRSSFYVRLHAIDPGSVCDSEASATLKVSKYSVRRR
jgi:hypothetical protein